MNKPVSLANKLCCGMAEANGREDRQGCMVKEIATETSKEGAERGYIRVEGVEGGGRWCERRRFGIESGGDGGGGGRREEEYGGRRAKLVLNGGFFWGF